MSCAPVLVTTVNPQRVLQTLDLALVCVSTTDKCVFLTLLSSAGDHQRLKAVKHKYFVVGLEE